MNVKEFVENNLENMKNDLGVLVSHNSVLASDEKPFGKETRACLDDALKLMEREGLKTKNLDYYCGYGEIGEGEKLIGILAHLDVVPAGEGWDSNPFKMVEKDGYLYGRGVTDDKGAVVASLYALKYLKETNYPFKKRVRLITGCNEETGSACIAYYVSKEGHIDLGFTPDGNFPGIYAEKGMVSARLIGHHTKFKDIKGGDASNVVCKKVTCRIENDLDINVFKAYLDDNAINYEIECEDNDLVITVYGKAAHASMPDQGVNAIMYLFEALYVAGFNDSFVSHIHKYFALTNHGELLKLEEIKDDVTDTSINLGVISKKDDDVILTFDMRFPVKTNSETVLSYLKVLNDGDNEFVVNGSHNPLYFDIESPMIKALHKAYVDVTGDREHQMEAIGGGTYAKAINNCIAFGCEFPGEDCHIHDANECLSIENFKRQVLIYVEAIKNLNEV